LLEKGKYVMEDYEEMQRYLRSNENKLICKPYVLECNRIAEITNQYSDVYMALYDELRHSVVKSEYSVGGEVLHRGYYCPSPIIDIVIGNAGRGKLLQRITKRSNPAYQYGFNKNNELVVVNKLSSFGNKEVIIRNNQKETGIAFSDEFGINTISECEYDNGQISSYVFCLYYSYNIHVVDYRKEVYQFSSEGLETVDMISLLNNEDAPILSHSRFLFQHDNEGYLSKYTLVHFENGSLKPSIWDGYEFDVKIKRRV